MTTDYEATHNQKKKLSKKEKTELTELEKYIESCQGGDRPMSPKAEKFRRYLYLKNGKVRM